MINLALFEFDGSGNIITSHSLPANLTSSYQSFSQQTQLNNQTKKVRFQFYLSTPNTIKADEMFIEPSSTIPGDLNGDNKVDIYDYNQLISDYGKTGTPGWIASDINKDGQVNIFDYSIYFTP